MRHFLIMLGIVLVGCQDSYTVPNHTPGVIKVEDGFLMVAYGEGGLIISDEATGEVLNQIFPPEGMHSIDDFDKDGDLIFVLDSRGRDYMAVFSYNNEVVELVSNPITVQGGPFNGISASNGNLVVAGGTTFLNRFRYSLDGKIEGPISFGRDRGHPDVLLSDDGQTAFVSTDFVGGEDGFGVSSLFIGDKLQIPFIMSELVISGSGFSPGVTSPVGFPIQTAQYDDNLLVAHGDGLTIINLSDGNSFASDINVDLGISGISVTVDENNAYVIGLQGSEPTLVTIDLTDINAPSIISTELLTTNGNTPTSVATSANEVYIAAGDAGIITLPKN